LLLQNEISKSNKKTKPVENDSRKYFWDPRPVQYFKLPEVGINRRYIGKTG
jgi:hypothetical protein